MTQMVVRIDEATERALAHLMELTGLNKSEVVRKTIQEAERQAIKQIMAQGYVEDDESKSESIEAFVYPSDEAFKKLGIERGDS